MRLVVLGALAARTARIGIGIVNVCNRSPALLAMAAAPLTFETTALVRRDSSRTFTRGMPR